MAIIVRGHEIANYRPSICVPVMGKNEAALTEEVKAALAAGAFFIEWRGDFYENLADKNAVCATLNKLRQLSADMILIFTVRSKAQGGEGNLSREYLKELLLAVAQCQAADFVDVEFLELEGTVDFVTLLQEKGTGVVTSHHDFNKTPSKAEMLDILTRMEESKADMAKLAVMPSNEYDVLSLLEVTNNFCDLHPDRTVITMSMGKLGQISRIAGASFGSAVTFASIKEASAPGQLSYDQAKEILETMGR